MPLITPPVSRLCQIMVSQDLRDGGDWGGKGEVKKLWEEKKVKKEKKCINQGGTNKER